MALYKGSKKISPIINIATTVRNQSKTVTQNGEVTYDEGYTGLEKVTVNIPDKDLRPQTITITENTSTTLNPTNFDGYSKVTINTEIPLQDKAYKLTIDDLSNAVLTITPDVTFAGMSSISIDFSELIKLLSEI